MSDLKKLKVVELKKLASKKGVTGYSKIKKDEFIKQLLKSEIKSPKLKLNSPEKLTKMSVYNEAIKVLGEDKVNKILKDAIKDQKEIENEKIITIALTFKGTSHRIHKDGEIDENGKTYDWNYVYGWQDISGTFISLNILRDSLYPLDKFIDLITHVGKNIKVILKGKEVDIAKALDLKKFNAEKVGNKIKYNYGAGAYDGWMEGDINLDNNHELHLELLELNFLK